MTFQVAILFGLGFMSFELCGVIFFIIYYDRMIGILSMGFLAMVFFKLEF